MIKFEMNSNLDENLFCPKCGAQVFKEGEQFDTSKLCKHVLFVAHDEGFEYSKDENIIKKYEEDEELEETLDEYLSKLDFQNGLLVTQYAPAPSFFGSYVGFNFEEN